MDNKMPFANSNSIRYYRKNSESIQSSTTSRSIILPANPLPKRKGIPLNSPRFGRMKRYINLPPFNQNDIMTKFEYKPQAHEKSSNPQLERQIEIQAYVNSSFMLSKLVYLKTKLDKEGKIDMENIVNLKKPVLFNKNADHFAKQYYTLENNDDTTLLFESRFESGNLLCAYKIDDVPQLSKYNLILQNDTNTTGYIQWFFFRITNTRKKKKVALSIVNLLRKTSLYSSGMKVWCYSERKAATENIGWHRAGENVTYYSNNMYVFTRDRKRVLYTLSFDYEFEYDNDTVYFANSLPYFFSDLMKELNTYQLEESKYPFFYRKTLCSTLGGNDLDMFSINGEGNSNKDSNNNNNNASDTRNGIILIARQHPGETCSSYVMKGAMEFLLGNSDEAIQLRKLYLIKIVPMVNVDGVIIGNSRTSFAGCDLNRRWASTNAIVHPEIYYTKEMIQKMNSQREISFICDFHGHIGAFNSFFYCNYKDNKRACSLFPFICSKTSKIISFLQSNFKMPKYKSGTGRISLFKELQLNNIVALETSFFGSNRMGEYNHVYFNSQILKEVGRDVCLGMLSYYYQYENKSIGKNLSLTEIDMKEFENEIIQEEKKCDSDESSESEPSIDNFDKNKIMNLLPTKFKYRKKKKSSKSSLMKSLFQFTSKRLDKDSENNADKILINSLKGSASTVSMANKGPFTLKESRSKSIPRATLINPMSQLSTNTSRFEKREILVDDLQQFRTRTDQGTQTEEVFFKMHWTYFAGKYPIKQAKNLFPSGKRPYDKSNNANNRNRGLNNNNFSFSNSGKYPMIANQNNYQSSQYRKQFMHGFQYNNY